MRPSFFCVALSVASVAACSSTGIGSAPPAPTPDPAPSATTEPLVCAPRDPSVCDSILRGVPDAPALPGTIAWAAVMTNPTSPDRQGGNPKVALLEDGTLQRSRIETTLLEYLEHPPGLVLAKVSAASVARIRADVAAVQAADLRGYFGEDESNDDLATTVFDVLRIPSGTACLHPSANPHSACAPGAIARLRDDLGALASAAEVKWRDTRVGNVALGSTPVVTVGNWPLSDDRAVTGTATFTPEEWASLGQQQGLFLLANGDTVYVSDFGKTKYGTESMYLSRSAVAVLGDDMADLRTQLLANPRPPTVEPYDWTGITLGPDRFPYFKNHDYARIPATANAPSELRDLCATGHLDLRDEGEVSLP